jgi:hypothetical protein
LKARFVAAGAIEKQTSEDALRVVEIGMLLRDRAQLALGAIDAAGVDVDHRPLVEQHRIVRGFLHDRVDAVERLVVAALGGGQLREDKVVGLVRYRLGHRRGAEREKRQQHQPVLRHRFHRITSHQVNQGRVRRILDGRWRMADGGAPTPGSAIRHLPSF